MKVFRYEGTPKRLSKIITENLSGYSYSFLQKTLRKGDVKVDGKRTKEDVLLSSAEITVYVPEKECPHPVFDNDFIAVFNKFSGISSEEFAEQISKDYPGLILVHRLDTNTTGLLIFAKTKEIYDAFKHAFSLHMVEKHYITEVVGEFPQEATFIDFLEKDSEKGIVKVFSVPSANRKEMVTVCKRVKTDGNTSILDVQPLTGRTHQIRAHLAYHGYPVIGDGKYGSEKINRIYRAKKQRLCAVKLIFHTAAEPLLSSLDGLSISIDYKF